MTAATILTEATVLAAAANLETVGITYSVNLDIDRLSRSVKETLTSRWDEILSEWEAMIGLAEWQTRRAVNLQANVYGKIAANAYLQ